MRGSACALVIAVFLPDSQLLAQNAPTRTWQWWAIGKNRPSSGSLLILPNASEAAEKDRAREGAKQQAEDRLLFDKIKFERLLYYRTERERAVSARIAREAAKLPFNPPRTTASATRPAPLVVGTGSSEVATPAPSALVGAPHNATPAPLDPVQAIDDLIDRTSEQLTGSPANAPARSGILVMLIVALFIVPSAAVAFLLLAVSHLRARIWSRGMVFATLGCFILWGALTAAQKIILPSPGGPPQPHWLRQLMPATEARLGAG